MAVIFLSAYYEPFVIISQVYNHPVKNGGIIPILLMRKLTQRG